MLEGNFIMSYLKLDILQLRTLIHVCDKNNKNAFVSMCHLFLK